MNEEHKGLWFLCICGEQRKKKKMEKKVHGGWMDERHRRRTFSWPMTNFDAVTSKQDVDYLHRLDKRIARFFRIKTMILRFIVTSGILEG